MPGRAFQVSRRVIYDQILRNIICCCNLYHMYLSGRERWTCMISIVVRFYWVFWRNVHYSRAISTLHSFLSPFIIIFSFFHLSLFITFAISSSFSPAFSLSTSPFLSTCARACFFVKDYSFMTYRETLLWESKCFYSLLNSSIRHFRLLAALLRAHIS